MPIDASAFKLTPFKAALWHPFAGPAHPSQAGILLGTDIITGARVGLDPWQLRLQENGLDATALFVYSRRGFGKSTLIKTLIVRFMLLQAGSIGGVPQRMTACIHTRKSEDGETEYGPVARALGCVPVPLSAMKINMFDPAMRMNMWHMLETAIHISEMMLGRPLRELEPLALQIAMFSMQQNHTSVLPELLEVTLRNLSSSDIDTYFNSSNQLLLSLGDERENAELHRHIRQVVGRGHNVDEAKLKADAVQLSSAWGQLLRGEYGQIFGGTASLRSKLEEPFLLMDWTGVNDKAVSLMQGILWKWRRVAQENNDIRIIPYLDAGDEEHEALKNLVYLRAMNSYLKMLRAFHTFILRATQFPTDFEAIGDQGTEMRNLALSIRAGAGAEIIGRQPDVPEIKDYWRSRGIQSPNLQLLLELPVGCFAFKLPGRAEIYYRLVLTPIERRLVQSDAAAKRLLDRVAFEGSVDDFRRLLQASAGYEGDHRE